MIRKGGIEYSSPKVILLNENGIGSAEYAGRTAYDSFSASENKSIIELNNLIEVGYPIDLKNEVNNIESSKLLDSLAWVHHHHSVIEHSVLTYLINGTSRGVLQELARHRIASYTVRSTRYTMSNILIIFLLSIKSSGQKDTFRFLIKKLNLFVTDDNYNIIEINSIFDKLVYQMQLNCDNFSELCLSKDALKYYNTIESISNIDDANEKYLKLQSFKKKRNVGDLFKHLVTDNWKTDLVLTINLRSLKNFFDLRDSGAAYFLIRELAKKMKEVTPKKYLSLIAK